MNQVLEKYLALVKDLDKQGKTGTECEYCGNTKSNTNRYGTFCSGCGAERKKIFGWCFGVPVYDIEDVKELCLDNVSWWNIIRKKD